MPIDLSTVAHAGTVREIALRMIADLKPGTALSAAEIAQRARCNPRSVLQCLADYPWKLTIRGERGRSIIVYTNKETHEAHQERAGGGTSNKTTNPARRR
jgi:hypothetical protein